MKVFIGVDIAKDKFDVAILKENDLKYKSTNFLQTKSGFDSFLKLINEYDKKNIFITMENTGLYHLKLALFLKMNNYNVSVVASLKMNRYAKFHNYKNKTDKLDAKIIAHYTSTQEFIAFKAPNRSNMELKQLTSTVDGLKRARVLLLNQLHALNLYPEINNVVSQSIEASLEDINKKIKSLNEEIKKIIDKKYQELYNYLTSIPGVGEVVANLMITNFGDFSSFNHAKQVLAFLGLNVVSYQSGKINRIRGISKNGNSDIRKNLYVASWSAIKYNKSCHDLYQRLLKKGKAKKVALIAVVSKLVRQIFGIAKSNIPYQEDFCKFA